MQSNQSLNTDDVSFFTAETWHLALSSNTSKLKCGCGLSSPDAHRISYSYVCSKVPSNLIIKKKSVLQLNTVLCNVSCLRAWHRWKTLQSTFTKHFWKIKNITRISRIACFIKLQPNQFAVVKCLYHNSSSELQLLIWSSWQGNFVPKLLGLDTAQLTEGPYFSLLEIS